MINLSEKVEFVVFKSQVRQEHIWQW